MIATRHQLIVGIGSAHGDDQAGWLVADLLQQRLDRTAELSSRCRVRKAAIPLDLLHWLDGVDELIVCDACVSADIEGTVQSLVVTDSGTGRLLEGLITSVPETLRGSHGFGVMDVLQLLQQTLGRLPATTLWLISGKLYTPGADVCDAVREAVSRVANEVECSLRQT